MKQRISAEDLKSLTPSQQEKLREWWKPQKGDWFVYVEGLLYFEHIIGECNGYNFDCEDNGSDQLKPGETSLPLLSIGQCIELLEERTQHREWWKSILYDDFYNGGGIFKYYTGELIDALWDAVKSIL